MKRKISDDLREAIRQNGFFVGAMCGSGGQGRMFRKYGADFILADSASRVRVMGCTPIAGFLPYGNSNDIVMKFAERELLPGRENLPVVFGLCATDPTIRLKEYIEGIRNKGFVGIANFPSIGIFDGAFQNALEVAGICYKIEADAIRYAHELGMFTVAYAYNREQAEEMESAGADVICLEGKCWEEIPVGKMAVLAKGIEKFEEIRSWSIPQKIQGYIGESCFEQELINSHGEGNLKTLISSVRNENVSRRVLLGREDYVNYVKWYVQKNYKRHLNFSEIAREMNLSRSYLSTVFNEAVGCSFQEYISDYRIKKAVSMIGDRNVPLCALAEMVGYEDYAHFSKVFKRKVGVSPSQYHLSVQT